MSSHPLAYEPQFSVDMTEEEMVAEMKRVLLNKEPDPFGFEPPLPTQEQADNMMKTLKEIGAMSNKTLRDVLK